jgi:hypothetical protein
MTSTQHHRWNRGRPFNMDQASVREHRGMGDWNRNFMVSWIEANVGMRTPEVALPPPVWAVVRAEVYVEDGSSERVESGGSSLQDSPSRRDSIMKEESVGTRY